MRNKLRNLPWVGITVITGILVFFVFMIFYAVREDNRTEAKDFREGRDYGRIVVQLSDQQPSDRCARQARTYDESGQWLLGCLDGIKKR